MFEEIFDKLLSCIKNTIGNKKFEEQQIVILEFGDIPI